MDIGAWQATVHRVARFRHNLVTKLPPCDKHLRAKNFVAVRFLQCKVIFSYQSVQFSHSVVSDSL